MSDFRLPDGVPTGLYIDGAWRPASGGATFAVANPATDERILEVADGTPQDAAAALDAACAAQASWAATSPRARGDLLRAAYERMLAERDRFAAVISAESGKPLADAAGEVAYGADYLRWYAEEAVRVMGGFGASQDGTSRILTTHEPVGPCYLISPWNFPLAMGLRKVAAALAAGCTSVLKPAQLTPLASLELARLLDDVGVPAGVVNVITGTSSGKLSAPLLSDPRLRKLSFTGSTEVGRTLIANAAEGVLRVSMELGGNAPFVVFEDADLDAAIEGAMIAKMRNTGQACTAANRFYVHASLYDAFAQRLAERIGALRMGAPGSDAEVGPLIDGRQRDSVAEMVDDALTRGARALTGGERVEGPGSFYPPTVLVDVSPDARVVREEIFGPVAPILSFDDEDAAIAAANDTEHGLVAYLFTRDGQRALRVAESMQTGMVAVNRGLVSNASAPFGGVKASGFGREGGREGIDDYLNLKYLAIAT
jgi:succinate-semialdehyde dehydrogenase/glutarate-semialdehyde dehydrogenase